MSYPHEVNKEYLKRRYADQRAMLKARLGAECNICGCKEGLEIDHIDWCKKAFNLGKLWPLKKLPEVYEELQKCQLLCGDCHRDKSAADLREQMGLRPFTHGTIYGWMKKKCTCADCHSAKRKWYLARNAERRIGGGRGQRVFE